MYQNLEWFAGLFEGEGCVSIVKQTSQYKGKKKESTYTYQRVELIVQMVDEDVIEKVHQFFGGNVRCVAPNGTNRQPIFRWVLGRKSEVRDLLQAMKPLMSQRRTEKIEAALEVLG